MLLVILQAHVVNDNVTFCFVMNWPFQISFFVSISNHCFFIIINNHPVICNIDVFVNFVSYFCQCAYVIC